jgi:hypothetical protein
VVTRVTGTFTGEMTLPDGKVIPRPRFALCTVTGVHVGKTRLTLAGTCAPLMKRPTDLFPTAM